MQTPEPSAAVLANPYDPARTIPLARGLLMTLRNLHGRDGGWSDAPIGRTLGIQRFLRAADVWIRDVERWHKALEAQPEGVAVEGDKQGVQHRSDCWPMPIDAVGPKNSS